MIKYNSLKTKKWISTKTTSITYDSRVIFELLITNPRKNINR